MLSRVLRYSLLQRNVIASNRYQLSKRKLLISSTFHQKSTKDSDAGPVRVTSEFLNIKKDNHAPLSSELSEQNKRIEELRKQDQASGHLHSDTINSVKPSPEISLAELSEKPSFPVRLRSLPLIKIVLQSEKDKIVMAPYIAMRARNKAAKQADWTHVENFDEEKREQILQESTDAGIKNGLSRGVIVVGLMVFAGLCYYFYLYGYLMRTSYDDRLHLKSVYNRAAFYSFQHFKEEFCNPKQSTLLTPLHNIPKGYVDINPKYCFAFEPLHLICTTEYDLQHHWRYKKRKGASRLLEQLYMPKNPEIRPLNDLKAECVLWTVGGDFDSQSWLQALAANRAAFLFRSSCDYVIDVKCWSDIFKNGGLNGHYIKKVDRLGRNLKKTILFDSDPRNVTANPKNCLLIKKPTDMKEGELDTTLYDLSFFLNSIVDDGIEDVRPIVEYYNKYGNEWLEKFKENKNKQLMEEETRREARRSKSAKTGRFGFKSYL